MGRKSPPLGSQGIQERKPSMPLQQVQRMLQSVYDILLGSVEYHDGRIPRPLFIHVTGEPVVWIGRAATQVLEIVAEGRVRKGFPARNLRKWP